MFDRDDVPMDTPYSFVVLGETTSTQDEARHRHSERPVLVVADRQKAGRGRSGAQWLNAERAVAMSLAFRPAWRPATLPVIPLMAGLTMATITGSDLKWPNDLLVGERKVGGILSEVSEGLVVVGIGLNLWWAAPPDEAGALSDDDPGPEAGHAIARAWADRFLEAIDAGPASFNRESYEGRCVTIGRSIVWEPDGAGTAVGVDELGGLVVETSGGVIVLRSGAVRHIRRQA